MVKEQKIQEITGEIIDLAMDEDFRGMPESVRDDLMQAFGGLRAEDLLREEYEHQVKALRGKGIDVTSVVPILTPDSSPFCDSTAQAYRAEVTKNEAVRGHGVS